MLHFVEAQTKGMDKIVLLNVRVINKSVCIVEMLTLHILPSFASGGHCHCLEVQTSTLRVVAKCGAVNIVDGLHTTLEMIAPKPK